MRHEHYGCCIFFEDGPALLEESLKAMKAIGWKVIAIDGAYQEFMKYGQIEKPYSTDGCIDVARSLADLYVPCPTEGWFDQPTKRNEYVKNVPVGDYFHAIDADEVIEKCTFDFGVEEDIYRMIENRWLHDVRPRMMDTIRTYKKYPDIGYKYQHSRTYRLDQHKEGDLESGLLVQAANLSNNMQRPLLKDLYGKDVMIQHYNFKRSLDRKRQKQNFYRMRKEGSYPW